MPKCCSHNNSHPNAKSADAKIIGEMLLEKIKNMTMEDIKINWQRSSEPMRRIMLCMVIDESEIQRISGKLNVDMIDLLYSVTSNGWNESEFADSIDLDKVFHSFAKNDSDLPYR